MIYHVTPKSQWLKALEEGFFTEDSLQKEGFIHMSTKEQVAGVLERYYKNIPDLVLLHVDENLLKSKLQYDLSPSIQESFPHVYGKINLDAVVEVETI